MPEFSTCDFLGQESRSCRIGRGAHRRRAQPQFSVKYSPCCLWQCFCRPARWPAACGDRIRKSASLVPMHHLNFDASVCFTSLPGSLQPIDFAMLFHFSAAFANEEHTGRRLESPGDASAGAARATARQARTGIVVNFIFSHPFSILQIRLCGRGGAPSLFAMPGTRACRQRRDASLTANSSSRIRRPSWSQRSGRRSAA